MANPTPAQQMPQGTGVSRLADPKPFKRYVYRGGDIEPPEVTAARARHRALNAALEQRLRDLETAQAHRAALNAEAMPDPAPGYEWQRELADE